MRASDTRAFFSDASRNVRPPLEDRILNHIYRLVWNRKLRVWQAASELATQSRGGRSSAQGNVAARMPRYAAGLALDKPTRTQLLDNEDTKAVLSLIDTLFSGEWRAAA